MKKIISFLLAVITVFLFAAINTTAAECSHSFLRSFVSATCTEKGHTLFSCQRCGYTYKTYDDEYTLPEGFYIIATSNRKDTTLTVKIDIGNNPGLATARLKMAYNKSTLSVRDIIIGDTWAENEFTGGINPNASPLVFFVESNPNIKTHNYNNGTFVSVVFDIIDPKGAYNIGLSHSKSDFVAWDDDSLSSIYRTPTLINIVGKSELAPHNFEDSVIAPDCTSEGYTLHACTICSYSEKDSFLPKAEHAFVFSHTIKESTFTEEGTAVYACSSCDENEIRTLPVLERWLKGDLNNDGSVNSKDANLMKRFLIGVPSSAQERDAADMNNDGKLNPMDANSLKIMLSGR